MAGKATARRLRQNATDAERALWRYLRNRSAGGAKFRRQQSIGPYIVDFVCFEARLIIEVDGGQHAVQADQDAIRTAYLKRHNFRVIRFWNNDVLTNPNGVFETIKTALKFPLP